MSRADRGRVMRDTGILHSPYVQGDDISFSQGVVCITT